MDDLYDDLLEVAGRGSKRKQKADKSGKKRRKAQFSSDEEPSEAEAEVEEALEEVSGESGSEGEDGGDEEQGSRKGRSTAEAPKSMPLKKRMAQQKEEDEESDEEDEAESLRRELGYGEDLYKDDADREALEKMTELKRETELADRAEKRDELMQQRELRRQQRAREKAEEEAKRKEAKRLRRQQEREEAAAPKASAERERESRRARTESRDERGKKDALSNLQALRAKRGLAVRGETEQKKKKKDEDYEEEGEESEGEQLSEEEKEEEEEEEKLSDEEDEPRRAALGRSRLQDSEDDEDDEAEDPFCDNRTMLSRVVLSRTTLEKWHREPFFNDTVQGCFVRVSIGVHPQDRSQVYRVARIAEVLSGTHENKELAVYKFPPNTERTTAKWLHLEIGRSRRPFRMELVSNTEPNDKDFDTWAKQMGKDELPMLRRSEIEQLETKIMHASDYRYTAEEVRRILMEKREQGKGTENLTREKNRLTFLRDQAVANGEPAEQVEELSRQIQVLEEQLIKGRAGLAKLSNINKRNKGKNDETSHKAAAEKADKKSDPSSTTDPFSRRPTQLSNYWSTKKHRTTVAAEEAAPAEAPAAAASAAAAAQAAKEAAAKEAAAKEAEKKGEMSVEASLQWLQDAHRGVNLSIDLGVVGTPREGVAKWRLPSNPMRFNVPAQKSLTLAEYLKIQKVAT